MSEAVQVIDLLMEKWEHEGEDILSGLLAIRQEISAEIVEPDWCD